MSIFNLHSRVVADYRDFVRSFFTIADDRARQDVEQALVEEAGRCAERLRDILNRGGELQRNDSSRAFVFKLHQFIGQGRALFATLEAAGGNSGTTGFFRLFILTQPHAFG
jgi:hypothetical protein